MLMDRRLALKTLTLPAAINACQSSPRQSAPLPTAPLQPSWIPTFLSVERALVLEAAAERLLPETDTPGATRCGVGPFIEAQLRDVLELPRQRAFVEGLDALDRAAVAAHGLSFPRCSEPQQFALLEALAKTAESEKPPPDAPEPFIRELRGLAIWALCDSQLGATTVLQYDPVPGEFQACVPLSEVGKAWAG